MKLVLGLIATALCFAGPVYIIKNTKRVERDKCMNHCLSKTLKDPKNLTYSAWTCAAEWDGFECCELLGHLHKCK